MINILLFLSLSYAREIRIGVIDTGINLQGKIHLCKTYDETNTGMTDRIGHGTNVTYLIDRQITKNIPHCYVIFKYLDKNIAFYHEALFDANKEHLDYLNISLAGPDYDFFEYMLLKNIIDKGTKVIVASGNNTEYLGPEQCHVYPACLDLKMYVIGNEGNRSNFGPKIYKVIDGNDKIAGGLKRSGSSQSAAIFTGTLVNGSK